MAEENVGMSKWVRFLEANKETTSAALEYDYKSNGALKSAIAEGLVFWKFVVRRVGNDYTYSDRLDWNKRREILSPFTKNPNPFIKLIAVLESLPTSVWREILWEANIDFMSFESFLRRVDKQQERLIYDCFDDLYVKKCVPRVFRWFKRRRQETGLKSLLWEKFDSGERYQSKGSWSYNLLGLDFGFNAYPKGIADDNKIVEVSPLRFLSTKNHADDFIVNTEFGKYWWLYQKARSNYVLFPNKKVELKTHICPGFWFTFLVHGFFWLLSPALFLWTVEMALSDFSYWLIPLGILGAVTPLWIISAFLKFAAVSLTKVTVFKRWIKEKPLHAKFLGWYILGMAVLLGCSISAYTFFEIGRKILGLWETLWCIVLMFMGIGYYTYHRIMKGENEKPSFHDYPMYFKIPTAITIPLITVELALKWPEHFQRFLSWLYEAGLEIFEFLRFWVEWAVYILVSAVSWLYEFLAGMFWVFGWSGAIAFVLVFSFPFVFIRLFDHIDHMVEARQKKIYAVMDKIAYALGFLFLAGFLSATAYLLYLATIQRFHGNIYFALPFLVIVGIAISTIFLVFSRKAVSMNPASVIFKKNLLDKEWDIFTGTPWGGIDYRGLSRNSWL